MRAPDVRVLATVSEVRRADWDALLSPASTPFVCHAWLQALERSGCAAARTGWDARHLTLWRGTKLIAAAPAYAKDDSDGDFSRDWDLAASLSRGRIGYYPKLALTVPFTPCTGERLLVAPGEDRAGCAERILHAARKLCADQGYPTWQVLFPDEAGARELEQAGMALRVSWQFHWRNEGYRSMAEFLARFNSKRRHMLRREMAAAAEQGIEIRTVRGEELQRDPAGWAKKAHALHRNTVDKLMWGRRWLNEKFYLSAFAEMPDAVEVVGAFRGDRLIAGAFNVASPARLYGRYWGCFEEHPFLHFNVCYYHSIADCIARGLQIFEGGAGGEHKLARGFLPALTWSAHGFTDARLDRAVRDHLARETPARAASIERSLRDSPIFKAAS
ncbi:MAG: GNAT family N-acetyltransferase [Deltaproteobacteria bacterium]|nr:MAG: GNAT family N-acetyltransferase [Deltaproteobacteria bacterium]